MTTGNQPLEDIRFYVATTVKSLLDFQTRQYNSYMSVCNLWTERRPIWSTSILKIKWAQYCVCLTTMGHINTNVKITGLY